MSFRSPTSQTPSAGKSIGHSFPLLILTPKGLGDVCALEIERIQQKFPEAGLDDLQVMSTGVHCRANLVGIMALNLMLRAASRVLVRLVEGVHVSGETETRRAAMAAALHTDWMSVDQSFVVEASVTETEGLSQQYLALLIKDGICDAFREVTQGKRPNIDRTQPNIRVFAKVERGRLWLSVDTSGRPLHQRGYRTPVHLAPGHHDAPMKEQLAAGILALAGWQEFCWHLHDGLAKGTPTPFAWTRQDHTRESARGSGDPDKPRRIPLAITASGRLVVPMCGSGTLAIEGALMLKNRWIRTAWQDFGFSELLPFTASPDVQTHFETLVTKMRAAELSGAAVRAALNVETPVTASDLEPSACTLTERSTEQAGVTELVSVTPADFCETTGPGEGTLMVLNPPYEKRMHSGKGDTYAWIGDVLKHRYPGTVAWIVSANAAAMKTVGLRPTRNLVVYNGALESKLSQFILYAAAPK